MNIYLFIFMSLIIVYLLYQIIILKKHIKLLKNLKPRDLWLIRERLKAMNPRDFEVFCGSLFSLLGYDAMVTKEKRDGGKDIILYDKQGKVTFVECKHWRDCKAENLDEDTEEYIGIDNRISKASPITQDIAQKLKGAMMYGLDGKTPIPKGIIITTTRFSEQCQAYCKAMNIDMIDMDGIMSLVEQVNRDEVYIACNIKLNGDYYSV